LYTQLVTTQDEASSSWTFTAVAQPSWTTEDVTGLAQTIGWSTNITQADLDAFPTSTRVPTETRMQKAYRLAELRYTTWRAAALTRDANTAYYIASGSAAVPASLLGGTTTTVTVTITPDMPDADYRATALLSGSATVLGGLVVQGVAVKTKNTVQVVVKNNALVSLSGGTVEVTAIKVVA
jgi:hypothetical protein